MEDQASKSSLAGCVPGMQQGAGQSGSSVLKDVIFLGQCWGCLGPLSISAFFRLKVAQLGALASVQSNRSPRYLHLYPSPSCSTLHLKGPFHTDLISSLLSAQLSV